MRVRRNLTKKIVAVFMCSAVLFNMCSCQMEERQPISQEVSQQEAEVIKEPKEQNKTEVQLQKSEMMTGPDVVDVKYMEIETPYAVLSYPEVWKDQLKVETNESENYLIAFNAVLDDGSIHQLFALTFGTGLENRFGQILQSDGSRVDVAIEFREIDGGNDTLLSMQEAANELLVNLPLTEEMTSFEESDSVEDIVIETPYGNLDYPGIWNEYLSVDHIDGDIYRISFTANVNSKSQELFVIEFGSNLEAEIGTVTLADGNVVSVRVQMSEMGNQWTDDELSILYAMQEAINNVIESIDFD